MVDGPYGFVVDYPYFVIDGPYGFVVDDPDFMVDDPDFVVDGPYGFVVDGPDVGVDGPCCFVVVCLSACIEVTRIECVYCSDDTSAPKYRPLAFLTGCIAILSSLTTFDPRHPEQGEDAKYIFQNI